MLFRSKTSTSQLYKKAKEQTISSDTGGMAHTKRSIRSGNCFQCFDLPYSESKTSGEKHAPHLIDRLLCQEYIACPSSPGNPCLLKGFLALHMQLQQQQSHRKQPSGPQQMQLLTGQHSLPCPCGSMGCAVLQSLLSAWELLPLCPEPCTSRLTRCRQGRCGRCQSLTYTESTAS